MNYFLMLLSVSASTTKSLLSKKLNAVGNCRYGLALSNSLIFSSALAGILLFAVLTGFGGISPLTVFLSLLYACAITAAQLLYMEALGCGAVSVTAFIYACGFLLPTAAGVLFWHEALTVTKASGTLLLLLAFFLIVRNPKKAGQAGETQSGAGLKWKLCSFGAMTMSGVLGILQKVHQTSAHKGELNSFLVLALSGALLLSLLLAFLFRGERENVAFTGGLTAAALICGVIFGGANILNLKLSGLVPATVQFPLVNGGTIILTAVMGRIVYRERLTWRKRAGILVGILAIYIISR